jgi:hypothetical protein
VLKGEGLMREGINFNNSTDKDETEFQLISVGQPFPLFQGSFPILKGRDAIIFEADEFGQGYLYVVYHAGIRDEEVYHLTKTPVQVRVLQSVEGFLLTLFKYGKTDMIHELSFDPTLYSDARALQFAESNNLVHTFCIDSNTNIVKGIRSANLPLKYIQLCKEVWSKAILQVGYSERYAQWYQNLQARYTTKQLWKMAIDVGYLGETYNLEEIKYAYKPKTEQ